MRDIRLRMRGVRQTLQVSSAMKLISTSKLRKARLTLAETEPFFDSIQDSMREIAQRVGRLDSIFCKHIPDPTEARALFVVMTSDRGLAGGFNAQVARFAEELMSAKRKETFLIIVGNVGQRYFLHSTTPVLENYTLRSKMPRGSDALEMADFIRSQYEWEAFDEVHVVYTRMRSSIKLVPETIRLLPIQTSDMGTFRKKAYCTDEARCPTYEYVPSPEAVFDALVPLYMKGVLFGALIESYASEQSARMTAMDEASKNASEMLEHLMLEYNRARQSAITQEVSEIVSGAAALG